jgi:hypothetical protein
MIDATAMIEVIPFRFARAQLTRWPFTWRDEAFQRWGIFARDIF